MALLCFALLCFLPGLVICVQHTALLVYLHLFICFVCWQKWNCGEKEDGIWNFHLEIDFIAFQWGSQSHFALLQILVPTAFISKEVFRKDEN